jgi:dicarboxylate transporter 10
MPTHFVASLLAGTVATTACAPADVLKSRIQNAVTVDGIKPVRPISLGAASEN